MRVPVDLNKQLKVYVNKEVVSNCLEGCQQGKVKREPGLAEGPLSKIAGEAKAEAAASCQSINNSKISYIQRLKVWKPQRPARARLLCQGQCQGPSHIINDPDQSAGAWSTRLDCAYAAAGKETSHRLACWYAWAQQGWQRPPAGWPGLTLLQQTDALEPILSSYAHANYIQTALCYSFERSSRSEPAA